MYFCKQCQEVRKLTVEGPSFFFLLNQSPYVQSLAHRLRKTVVWVRLPVNNRPNMYIRKKISRFSGYEKNINQICTGVHDD